MIFKKFLLPLAIISALIFFSANFAFADPVDNPNCPMNDWVFSPSVSFATSLRGNFYELTFKEYEPPSDDRSSLGKNSKIVVAQIYIKAFDKKTKQLRATLNFEYSCSQAVEGGCDAFYKDRPLHLSVLNPGMSTINNLKDGPIPFFLLFRSISDRIFKKKFPPFSKEDQQLFDNFSENRYPAAAENLAFWDFMECRASK